jgi:hypothetical protein
MQAIQYDIYTTRIQRLLESDDPAMLAAQASLQPANEATLTLETALAPMDLDHYAVIAGELTAKTASAITASPNPFTADGVTECSITLDPFAACTLVVNGTTYALTDEDQTLVLTSDVPATFLVELEWLRTHWADPITVIAEEA